MLNPKSSSDLVLLPFASGLQLDLSQDDHPTRIYSWLTEELILSDSSTYFGFVTEGPAYLTSLYHKNGRVFELEENMYFSVPSGLVVHGGRGMIVECLNFAGTFLLGGPIERTGRFRYIDGCTDSLLIPPVIKGAPCLNYLHFPIGINQTMHTHPSIRCGLVARGSGKCIVPGTSHSAIEEITLEPGKLFVIPANGNHSFHTDGSEMEIIAYHPDSDYGPTDQDHPVLNRTMIDGISAAKLNAEVYR